MKRLILRVLVALPMLVVMLASVGQKDVVGSELAIFYSDRGKKNALGSLALPNNQEKQAMQEQAMADFKKALELNPRCEKAYEYRGSYYWATGQYDQAMTDFSKALEINPRNANAYNFRGATYAKKRQYDRAIADYNKALEIDPSSAAAYFNRAASFYYMKNYDKAWEDVHKVKILGTGLERFPTFKAFLGELRKASGREN